MDANIYLKTGVRSLGDDPSRPLYCTIAVPQTFVPQTLNPNRGFAKLRRALNGR
jgi:hypothetical protein